MYVVKLNGVVVPPSSSSQGFSVTALTIPELCRLDDMVFFFFSVHTVSENDVPSVLCRKALYLVSNTLKYTMPNFHFSSPSQTFSK